MSPMPTLKKKRRLSWLKDRDTFTVLPMIVGMLFFVLTFIFWGISKLIEENFILSEIFGAFSAASMCLCFSLIFFGLMIGTKNWFGRIASFLAAAVIFAAGYSFAETSILLFKDKTAFELKQFEKLIAVPTHAEFDDADVGPEYVMELQFNDLTIDVYNQDITRAYYIENLAGKTVEVHYLPNSRFAVSVKKHLED